MALERGTPSAKSVEKRASIDSLTYDKGSAKPNDYETPSHGVICLGRSLIGRSGLEIGVADAKVLPSLKLCKARSFVGIGQHEGSLACIHHNTFASRETCV